MSAIDRAELARRHEQRLKLLVPAAVEELKGLSLFSGLPEKARDKILEKIRQYVHWVEFGPGDIVLRQGDYSDSAFFIVSGTVEVQANLKSQERFAVPRLRSTATGAAPRELRPRSSIAGMVGKGQKTFILADVAIEDTPDSRVLMQEGEVFGEVAALSRYAVGATVKSVGTTRLLQLRLPGLRMLMKTSKEFQKFVDDRYRRRTLSSHLRNVDLFSKVDARFLKEMQERAELLSFEPGQIIVDEGTEADAFYLVRGGYVRVSVRAGVTDLVVTYLRKGEYVGETALLMNLDWPFTLQAMEYVELVKISKEDFRRLLAVAPDVEDKLWNDGVAQLKARGSVMRDPISSEYLQMAAETGLIHGESVLLIDLATCTRCDDCVRACAETHGGTPRFVREGYKYRNWLIPSACYQCTDPVCMTNCPTGAITREVGTLEVTINEETCIGCSNCAKSCPWDNIVMIETGEVRTDGKAVEVASKCDLCISRPEGPACVQMCPQGATIRINFKDIDRVSTTLR